MSHKTQGAGRGPSPGVELTGHHATNVKIFSYQWGAITVVEISPQELPDNLIYLFSQTIHLLKINFDSIVECKSQASYRHKRKKGRQREVPLLFCSVSCRDCVI